MLRQKSLFEFLPDEVVNALERMAESNPEERGAVFTKQAIVEFILDLAGYVKSADLINLKILEPSFGNGEFVFSIVDRLVSTIPNEARKSKTIVARLAKCIRAVEVHQATFLATKVELIRRLVCYGFRSNDSEKIVTDWLVDGDFLLSEFQHTFDVVVGNPPYLRQERIPTELLIEYRRRFRSMYDRADLYIPFIEHSLSQVADGGKLCFICADRWTKNKYGGPIRKLIATSYRLRAFASLVGVDAFHNQVNAYPAIMLVSREESGPTSVAKITSLDSDSLKELAKQLTSENVCDSDSLNVIHSATNNSDPWLLEPTVELSLVRRLEASYPTLEASGCKIGIGVATGADKVFIGEFESLDVEESRKLPLATTSDISGGVISWNGLGVVNPFEADGTLASFEKYPRFAKFILNRRNEIASRHVAKKSPASWYRTIDRIYPELAKKPKLLIPDIKGDANVAYDSGTLYPHHNLYYITSQVWDLQVLRAVLSSGIARLFVAAYTTKMRGGYFRFQAQYLRKIRLPEWQSIPLNTRRVLLKTCSEPSSDKFNDAVCTLYGISKEERKLLGWELS